MPTKLHSNTYLELILPLFVLTISSAHLNCLLTVVSGLEIGEEKEKGTEKKTLGSVSLGADRKLERELHPRVFNYLGL